LPSQGRRKEMAKSKVFIKKVRELAKEYNLNFFIVTDGASAISNNGNKIVEKHRNLQIELDKEMGINPFDDWEKKKWQRKNLKNS
jgi:hypothetical protein